MSRPVVYKFGGTSVADAPCIERVARIVSGSVTPPVVIVSAMAGVTDALLALGEELLNGDAVAAATRHQTLRDRHLATLDRLLDDPEGRRAGQDRLEELLSDLPGARGLSPHGEPDEVRDRVAAYGERLSAVILHAALQSLGCAAQVVDAGAVIRTDATFGRARPQEAEIRSLCTKILVPLVRNGNVPVVPGFTGATDDGRPTTLGRGGSDFSAVLVGAALDAEAVHIWTDVEGMLSGDPRAVDRPRILEEVGFEEAVELAYFGAKVIHSGAAKYAVSRGVALRIRSSFTPEAPGTRILNERQGGAEVAAIAYKRSVILIEVRSHPTAIQYGFLAGTFEVLGRHRVPVDLVATSHSSTAFTVDENEKIEDVEDELRTFSDVQVTRNLATITIVGRGLLDEPGIGARVFAQVGRTHVYLVSQASGVSLSLVVGEGDAPGLVRRLHRALVETLPAAAVALR